MHGVFAPNHKLRRAVTALAIGNLGKLREAPTGGHARDAHAMGSCCDATAKPPTSRTIVAKVPLAGLSLSFRNTRKVQFAAASRHTGVQIGQPVGLDRCVRRGNIDSVTDGLRFGEAYDLSAGFGRHGEKVEDRLLVGLDDAVCRL